MAWDAQTARALYGGVTGTQMGDKKLYRTLGIMLLLGLALEYLAAFIIGNPGGASAHSFGFLLGRAFANVLVPLLLLAIPAGLYKAIKKRTMPGYYVWLWGLWILMGFVAIA